MKITRALVGLSLVVAVAACKKDSSKDDKRTPVAQPVMPARAAVDATQLVAPPLFAHIPADTPWVVASFEAIPIDYWSRIEKALGPTMRRMRGMMTGTDAELDRLIEAVLAELDGKWNAKGFESLGFSPTPRLAMYGHGLLPVVARIELADDKLALATVKRIAQRAGITLPPLEKTEGKEYWKIHNADAVVVIGMFDKQLVVAAGRPADITRDLRLVLGLDKPAANMADGKMLADLVATYSTTYGFGPHLIGFVDNKKLASLVIGMAPADVQARCRAAVDPVLARVPRAVMSYNLRAKDYGGGILVELAPDLVGELKKLKTEMPGLFAAIDGDPAFAMGGAADLDKSRTFIQGVASTIQRVGQACDVAELAEAGGEIADTMASPLPPPAASITGAVISVHAFAMKGGMSFDIDGLMMIGTTSGKQLLSTLEALSGPLGIPADGRLHAIDQDKLPLPIPIKLEAGVGDRNVVVAAGPRGSKIGAEVLGATGGGPVPFFVVSYDYAKLAELQAQMASLGLDDDPAAQLEAQANKALADMFGRATLTVDVGDKGLALWGSLELK